MSNDVALLENLFLKRLYNSKKTLLFVQYSCENPTKIRSLVSLAGNESIP